MECYVVSYINNWKPLSKSKCCIVNWLTNTFVISYIIGRGDFKKKSQKVPAFWKMAAVTVIRLLVYIMVPSCIALYCRPRTMGVENIK